MLQPSMHEEAISLKSSAFWLLQGGYIQSLRRRSWARLQALCRPSWAFQVCHAPHSAGPGLQGVPWSVCDMHATR